MLVDNVPVGMLQCVIAARKALLVAGQLVPVQLEALGLTAGGFSLHRWQFVVYTVGMSAELAVSDWDDLDGLASEVEDEARGELTRSEAPSLIKHSLESYDRRRSQAANPDTALAFDKNFAFEIALQYDEPRKVMERFGVDVDTMRRLAKYPPFVMAVRQYRSDIKREGVSFEMKSKVMAEALLETAYELAINPETPATVRTTNIANIVRWGKLEPPKVTDTSGGGGTQFSIAINLDGGERAINIVAEDDTSDD